MAEAAIEARALTKTYGNVQAAAGVSFRVPKGEIYGFLGPNGAGKTTTLKMILGLTKPTQGVALLDGVDVAQDPVRARQSLGYLPESMSLYKTLTGRQTLRFFAELRGAPKSEVDERLQQVGLAEAANRRVGTYSKGMAQRLAIAQALLASPKLLILDEPTSGLDPAGARWVKDLLRGLNGQGTTILFSSHILSEVQELAQRVAILSKGVVVAEDEVANLRSSLAMRGTLRIHLASPPPAGAEAALRAIAGVETVSLRGSTMDLTLDPSVRWQAIKAAEGAGCIIRDIQTQDATLEDVFLQVTRGGSA
ncbi:MAG: ABC transporter ATP-binding protein [Thermoplasmatota archaeon]